MWKKSKITDQTASGQGPEQAKTYKRKVGIKKRSKVPGVMITQYVVDLPEGKTTPDFIRKPIALTIQEGKMAIFKAVVSGEPKPEITWKRAKGDMTNQEKFLTRYDETSNEYTLEISKVTGEEADTYKCFAVNEFGKAVCTASLNVIEVGFKMKKAMQDPVITADPAEFRKMLRKSSGRKQKEETKKDGEIDDKFWEVLLSADKKDYERICSEYGVTDFRWMLRKLTELKKEREEEQAMYVNVISNLKHIEVKGSGVASFELDLELKDPSSRIFLYKDGVMVPYSEDMEMKHNLKMVGKKLIFTINDLLPEDAGLYQVDVEEVNVFSTEFKIPNIDFIVKIQEVKAKEREDAIFECVLSQPMSKILWMGKNALLENGEKYQITVSEDRLIHRLCVRDCMQLDKGIYSAVAGIKTCSAWLVVEVDKDASAPGKKAARKTTQAGGSGMDLEKLAKEHQAQLQKDQEDASKKSKEGENSNEKSKAPTGTVNGDAMANGLDGSFGKGLGLDDGSGRDGQSGLVNGSGLDDGSGLNRGMGQGKGAGLHGKGGLYSGAGLDGKGGLHSGAGLDGKGGLHSGAGLDGKGGLHSGAGLDGKGGLGKGTGLNKKGGLDEGAGKGKGVGAGGASGLDSSRDSGPSQKLGTENGSLGSGESGDGSKGDKSGGEEGDGTDSKKKNRTGPLLPDTIIDPNVLNGQTETGKHDGSTDHKGSGAQASDRSADPNELNGQTETGRQGEPADHKGKGPLVSDRSTDPNVLNGQTETGRQGGPADHKGKGPLVSDRSTDPNVLNGHTETGRQGGPADHKGKGPLVSDRSTGHTDNEGTASNSDLPKGQGSGAGNKQGGGQGKETENGEEYEQRPGNGLDDSGGSERSAKRSRQGPLLPDQVIDPGVQFVSGLSDVKAIVGQPAELVCKLSSDSCDGAWYKDGRKLSPADGVTLAKDGACHKLTIDSCQEKDSGKYRFEADGRKTEAMIIVEDPPRFDPDDLDKFSKHVIVKAGQNASFKMPFVGREPMKVQWFKEGEELQDDTNIRLENTASHSRLLLSKCQRKDGGEIKIKVKNDFGTLEAVSKLIVLDKPTPPQGPVEVVESSASCIEMKWRPPKDDGGSPVQGYTLERQQVGRNTWKKLGEIPAAPGYRDTDVDHGRKYCYRIRAVTKEGVSDPMETPDVTAGTKEYPGPPASPKVVSAFSDHIDLTWSAPTNTGGTRILGYNLEKRKRGSNLWSQVNPTDEPIQEKKYRVKDVIAGMAYEFRVSAINMSGVGEPSIPCDFVTARDPKKPPGTVKDLRVTDSTYTTLTLAWNKPSEEEGVQDEAKGYLVEIRPAESQDWQRCNTNPLTMTTFTVKGLKSMGMYWVRVIATNEGGEGVPQDLDNYIIAMPPPVRPKFTDTNMKSFMVVRAGNSVRVNINFEASPMPDVIWLKDNMPVSKRVTISNAEGTSQILIPTSDRCDTGVYTVIIKNIVGQETFSVEIRVTDDPKPPGPVELEENVRGTVTVNWEPSPDEKRDDHLHYLVTKRDSSKQTWGTVADRLFNNKCTVCNIMPGREYHFRVYAKNDMGMSEPSESPTWGTTRKREKFAVSMPELRPCNFQSVPSFLVPLKMHMAPQGYECYMSCAVTGNPRPHVTWYRNNVSLNTNTNYYISNTCGVCSMLILRVGPKDEGDYTVMAENSLGRAECSTKLTVRE